MKLRYVCSWLQTVDSSSRELGFDWVGMSELDYLMKYNNNIWYPQKYLALGFRLIIGLLSTNNR